MSLPLVSVIVRTKDRPELLGEALASLAGQSYPRVQAIVVNDGGVDVEEIVVQSCRSLQSYVYHRNQETRGRSAALNIGLSLAAGSWIGFLDDDDLFLPDHLSLLINAVSTKRAGMAYCQTRVSAYAPEEKSFIIGNPFAEPAAPFSRARLMLENFIPIISALVQRQAMDRAGPFDETLAMYEDWDFFIRLSAVTACVEVDAVTTLYRRQPDSITIRNQDNELARRCRAKVWRKHGSAILQLFPDIYQLWRAADQEVVRLRLQRTTGHAPGRGDDNSGRMRRWSAILRRTALNVLSTRYCTRLQAVEHRIIDNFRRLVGPGGNREPVGKTSALPVEQDFVPFAVSPLPPGPWLVFAPHADDETLGMGGTLLLARAAGVSCHLVVLTDGSLGGAGAALIAQREQEALRVAAVLKLAGVDFWRQPDRELLPTPDLAQRVAGLVRALKPATVFFPSVMEYHPDHRTAALLVRQGLDRCCFAGLAMSYEISCQTRINRLVDITGVVEEKNSLISLYKSQLTCNNYREIVNGLNASRAFSLPAGALAAEGFYGYKPGEDLYEPARNAFLMYTRGRKAVDR